MLRWLRIAWWGLVAPLREEEPLVLHQAVVLGPEGVLLAVRCELHGWELPGGQAHATESGEAAVRREVLEETGIEVEVQSRVAKYLRSGFRPHVAHIYRCRPVGGTLRPSDETPAVAWFKPAEVPKTLFPWFRGPLRDGLDSPTRVQVRRERQGFRAILAGARIDIRMRLRPSSWQRDAISREQVR
jgi:ADP-ribose pyrophosphatase YjhB (NUDIX family)